MNSSSTTSQSNKPFSAIKTKNILFPFHNIYMLTNGEIWITLTESFCSSVMPGSELDAKVSSRFFVTRPSSTFVFLHKICYSFYNFH